MPALHVAIDCRVVDPRFPGIGRATLETVRCLVTSGRTGRLSLLHGQGEASAELADLGALTGVELVAVPAALRHPSDQGALPLLLRRLRPDVFHATYYAVPALLPVRHVVTIYDLIPRLFPQYWPNPLTRRLINLWTAYAARRAQGVLACSQATADDIARLLPGTAGKLAVAPLGVTPRRTDRQPVEQATPYLLYVGSNKPHKNLPRLVTAFARIADQVDCNLIIAGAWDPRYPEALHEAGQPGLAGRVHFERSPSDAALDRLYAGARAFVFPSRYEGFGLPVLEAMAAGLPVATTNRGALREVAGDAALLFDPDDDADMATALRQLCLDGELRERLSRLGQAQATRYPWSRTAELTWTAYERVARSS